jgi:hypothetical protein
MTIDFPHKRSTHCETGCIKNLLKFYGHEISEAMIFGIGSGYDFIHFPFPLFDGHEIPVFRILPVRIFSQFTDRMNIDCSIKSFINKDKSMDVLDSILEQEIPVGVVTEVFDLPYFPLKGRRFSGHHIVIIGKEDDEYILSDTDLHFPENTLNRIKADDLKKARFTEGILSPRGKLFYINSLPDYLDLKTGIIKGIKNTCYNMLAIPFPYFGVKGIEFLSRRMRKYEKIYGKIGALDNLLFQLQISEEGGSGGSGFRYLYGHFLSEASEYLNDDKLHSIADFMMKIADMWQTFAVESLRFHKDQEDKDFNFLADIIFSIAPMEKKLFTELKEWVETRK